MIKAILSGVFKVIISLVGFVLAPIDLAINTALPNLATAFSLISSLFDLIGSYVSWVLSYFGLYPDTISLAVLLITFIVTIPITFDTIKLAIKWYNALKV